MVNCMATVIGGKYSQATLTTTDARILHFHVNTIERHVRRTMIEHPAVLESQILDHGIVCTFQDAKGPPIFFDRLTIFIFCIGLENGSLF